MNMSHLGRAGLAAAGVTAAAGAAALVIHHDNKKLRVKKSACPNCTHLAEITTAVRSGKGIGHAISTAREAGHKPAEVIRAHLAGATEVGKAATPKALCAGCGKVRSLKADGNFRAHLVSHLPGVHSKPCSAVKATSEQIAWHEEGLKRQRVWVEDAGTRVRNIRRPK